MADVLTYLYDLCFLKKYTSSCKSLAEAIYSPCEDNSLLLQAQLFIMSKDVDLHTIQGSFHSYNTEDSIVTVVGDMRTPLPKAVAAGFELMLLSTAESSLASTSWSPHCGRCTATSWNNSAHRHMHTELNIGLSQWPLVQLDLPTFNIFHIWTQLLLVRDTVVDLSACRVQWENGYNEENYTVTRKHRVSFSNLLTYEIMAFKLSLNIFFSLNLKGLSNINHTQCLMWQQTQAMTTTRIYIKPTRCLVALHGDNNKDDPSMVCRCVDGVNGISNDISLKEITQHSQKNLSNHNLASVL